MRKRLVVGVTERGTDECAWMAIDEAAHDMTRSARATVALSRWLGLAIVTDELGEVCIDPLVAWNDAPERTAEDVILALKQTAYDLEETEQLA